MQSPASNKTRRQLLLTLCTALTMGLAACGTEKHVASVDEHMGQMTQNMGSIDDKFSQMNNHIGNMDQQIAASMKELVDELKHDRGYLEQYQNDLHAMNLSIAAMTEVATAMGRLSTGAMSLFTEKLAPVIPAQLLGPSAPDPIFKLPSQLTSLLPGSK